MIVGEPLFHSKDLSDYLRSQVASLDDLVRGGIQDSHLSRLDDELAEQFVASSQIDEIIVDFDNPQRQTSEARVTVPDHFRGSAVIDGVRVQKIFPFSGSPRLLNMRASTWSNVPRGRVDGNRIILEYQGHADPETIKRDIAQQEGLLRDNVSWLNQDIARHNESLPRLLTAAVQRRRQSLESVKKITDF